MSIESTENFESVMRRVRKLLTTAAGNANEHESAVAAGMAARLMEKYNISMVDVIAEELKNFDKNIVEETVCEWGIRS